MAPTTVQSTSESSISTKHARQRKEKDKWDSWKYASVGSFILLYYLISVTLSMFNTQVLGKSRMNFPFPIYAAVIYDLIQFSLAATIMTIVALAKKRKESAVGPIKAYKQLGSDRYWKVIVPCAIAAGLDIALSNCSLKHISLSFYTMVKSSSPMFILIFAFVFRLEKLSWSLGLIVGVIGLGTLLTVYNPASFNLIGFVLVFSAAVMSGIRWALTQLIIEHQVGKDEKHKSADGPLSAILFLTPPIGVTMILLCAVFEGFPKVISTLYAKMDSALRTSAICLTGGVMTFSLILTEYKVVESTSVVTLSISGIVKEILMISVSVLYFKDTLHPINYVGLLISICGIIGYNWYKIKKGKSKMSTMVGDAMYLAVPTDEPLGMSINPFGEDSEDEETAEYFELEEQPHYAATEKSCLSSRMPSRESIGSKSMTNVNKHGMTDAEECFQGLKSHWSSLPALDHFPPVHPESAPNTHSRSHNKG